MAEQFPAPEAPIPAPVPVQQQGSPPTVVVQHTGPNHVLHFILTLLTSGLWLPVWLIVTLMAGNKKNPI